MITINAIIARGISDWLSPINVRYSDTISLKYFRPKMFFGVDDGNVKAPYFSRLIMPKVSGPGGFLDCSPLLSGP